MAALRSFFECLNLIHELQWIFRDRIGKMSGRLARILNDWQRHVRRFQLMSSLRQSRLADL